MASLIVVHLTRQSPLKECMSLHMSQKLRLILSNFELESQVMYKVHNSKAHKTGNHKHLTFKKKEYSLYNANMQTSIFGNFNSCKK